MCNHLRILIVEDDDASQAIIERILRPIKEAFPDAITTKIKSLIALKEQMNQEPPQDIILLDLGLIDSLPQNTLDQIQWIENHAPVVIITGYEIDFIRKLLDGRHNEIEIIHKQDMGEPGIIIGAIVRAISRKRVSKEQKVDQLLVKLKSLADAAILRQ